VETDQKALTFRQGGRGKLNYEEDLSRRVNSIKGETKRREEGSGTGRGVGKREEKYSEEGRGGDVYQAKGRGTGQFNRGPRK